MFSLFRLRSRTVRQVSLFRSAGSEVILFLQKVNTCILSSKIDKVFWEKSHSDIAKAPVNPSVKFF
jgi:hypothetical protein